MKTCEAELEFEIKMPQLITPYDTDTMSDYDASELYWMDDDTLTNKKWVPLLSSFQDFLFKNGNFFFFCLKNLRLIITLLVFLLLLIIYLTILKFASIF